MFKLLSIVLLAVVIAIVDAVPLDESKKVDGKSSESFKSNNVTKDVPENIRKYNNEPPTNMNPSQYPAMPIPYITPPSPAPAPAPYVYMPSTYSGYSVPRSYDRYILPVSTASYQSRSQEMTPSEANTFSYMHGYPPPMIYNPQPQPYRQPIAAQYQPAVVASTLPSAYSYQAYTYGRSVTPAEEVPLSTLSVHGAIQPMANHEVKYVTQRQDVPQNDRSGDQFSYFTPRDPSHAPGNFVSYNILSMPKAHRDEMMMADNVRLPRTSPTYVMDAAEVDKYLHHITGGQSGKSETSEEVTQWNTYTPSSDDRVFMEYSPFTVPIQSATLTRPLQSSASGRAAVAENLYPQMYTKNMATSYEMAGDESLSSNPNVDATLKSYIQQYYKNENHPMVPQQQLIPQLANREAQYNELIARLIRELSSMSDDAAKEGKSAVKPDKTDSDTRKVEENKEAAVPVDGTKKSQTS